MKRTRLILIVTLFIQNALLAQSYTVTYEKEHRPDVGNQLDKITDPALKKQLEARLIKVEVYELLHKEGVSNFSVKQESKDEAEDETLELQGTQKEYSVNMIHIGPDVGSTVLYKDLTNKVYLKSTSLISKDFLIKDTLPLYDWKISDETKPIGNYVCKKATALYNDKEIIAWYAPSIPINDGPDKYYGLPGLIIELTNGNTTYNALSVQQTPDISITKPDKGKKTSEAEYQKLKQERIEAIKQQYKN